MKKNIEILSLISLLTFSTTSCDKNKSANETATRIEVDFSKKIGTEVQNIKKINMFSPTWEFCGTGAGMSNPKSVETLDYLDDLQSEQFRIDLMMGNGGIGSQIGKNGDGQTDFEYDAVMDILEACKNNNASTMLVMCDIPEYAQLTKNSKVAPDMESYSKIIGNIVTYFKNHDIQNITYETWNEPDLGSVFWGDTMANMIDTSICQTKAIRKADPYATVSSLGLCWPLEFLSKKQTEEDGTMTSWKRFWTRSKNNDAMPDALSWHYYGQVGGIMEGNDDFTTDFSYWLEKIRNSFNTTQNGTNPEIDEKIDLSKIQQLVTEYHPANSNDSWYDTTSNISKMFDSIEYALDATDLTKVYWACYISELFGVINKYNYQKNPGFNVLWSYARLPMDRISVTCSDKNIGMYCGADSSRAGYIVYNKDDENNKKVSLDFSNIPFDYKNMTIYQIDAEHLATTTDTIAPYIYSKKNNISSDDLKNITLDIKANTGFYIEINNDKNQSEIEQFKSIGTILKKEYYYYDRGNKLPYSDLHNNSLTATLSMCDSMSGRSAVSAIIDTKNEVETFDVNFEGWGNFIKTNGSALGFKIDYQTDEGFTKSTYYSIANNDYDLILPFGSRSLANEKINMSNDINGSYKVLLKDKAPSNWNGIIQITYIVKDIGYGATEKIRIN